MIKKKFQYHLLNDLARQMCGSVVADKDREVTNYCGILKKKKSLITTVSIAIHISNRSTWNDKSKSV